MNITSRISNIFAKRIAFTATALLLVTMAWGQQIRLQGGGTADNPYLISNATDWAEFTSMINGGTGNSAYYKLTSDITLGSENRPLTTVVGLNDSNRHRFKGHFDGDWHTITIYQVREENIAGPFGTIENATICNLTVEGTIITSRKFAGGIAGYSYSNSSTPITLTNCTSNVTIDCSTIIENSNGNGTKPYDCTHGGLIGQNNTGPVHFSSCLFSGAIIDTKSPKTANRVTGFLSWQNTGPTSYTNCTMAGELSVLNTYATFQRGNGSVNTGEHVYFINNYGGNVGSAAPTSALSLSTIYRVMSSKYIPGQISGLETVSYPYTGNPITITPIVTFFGKKLTQGTDYTIQIRKDGQTVTQIREVGEYQYSIRGTGNYGGTFTTTIHVFSDPSSWSWSDLSGILSGGDLQITLDKDYTAGASDGAIVINGDVELDMAGHTLNRNLGSQSKANGFVIHVMPNASLTISDGTIRGGNNIGNGGGIYNEGVLTLNNVVVTDNKANRDNQSSSIYGTGGGIYNASRSSLTMNGGTLSGNTASGGGGGIHGNSTSRFMMTDVEVSGNRSSSKGGGIRIKGNATITNCNITRNQLPEEFDAAHGGGVFTESGSVTMTNCQISENVAFQWGGGICVFGGSNTKLNNCTIQDNSSTSAEGGGVYVRPNATLSVAGNVIINDNTDRSGNGNVFFEVSQGFITIYGELRNTARIGVKRTSSEEGTFTENLRGNGTIANFISDDSNLHVELDENQKEAVLVSGPTSNPYRFIGGGSYEWSDQECWRNGLMPDPQVASDVTIAAKASIPDGYIANVNRIDFEDEGSLSIMNGGQLIHLTSVTAALQKSISKYTSDNNGWYTIASPVTEDFSTSGIATGAYDLFVYDEKNHYWWNSVDQTYGFTELVNGKGYLYASSINRTLTFTGEMRATTDQVSVSLSYDCDLDNVKGYNLVGNPFTRSLTYDDVIKIGGNNFSSYLIATGGGSLTAYRIDERRILPGEGFFVQATAPEQSLTFNASSKEGKRDKPAYLRIEAGNEGFSDRAYVQLGQGNTLRKMDLNDNGSKVYVMYDGKDYAAATIEETEGEIPVHFKTSEDGDYTITVSAANAEIGYLHLIDNKTRTDINMLVEPKYSFSAKTTDAESRFKLVFRISDEAEETNHSFAFINNGQIILFDVEGEGILQVLDLLGHVLVSESIESTVSVEGMRSGVYVLRLLQSERTLTQKIVIQN